MPTPINTYSFSAAWEVLQVKTDFWVGLGGMAVKEPPQQQRVNVHLPSWPLPDNVDAPTSSQGRQEVQKSLKPLRSLPSEMSIDEQLQRVRFSLHFFPLLSIKTMHTPIIQNPQRESLLERKPPRAYTRPDIHHIIPSGLSNTM